MSRLDDGGELTMPVFCDHGFKISLVGMPDMNTPANITGDTDVPTMFCSHKTDQFFLYLVLLTVITTKGAIVPTDRKKHEVLACDETGALVGDVD